MATKLRKLKITRVAVVDQGANQDADILLFKRAPDDAHAPCQAQDCTDPACPEHGENNRTVATKDLTPMHDEPDGDEQMPLDYATRAAQEDVWSCLWHKWQRFCDTFYACVGDSDADNVGYLPVLVRSIEQFGTDVADLLTATGVAKELQNLLTRMVSVAKSQPSPELPLLCDVFHTLLIKTSPIPSPFLFATQKGISMAESLESVTKRAEAAETQLQGVQKAYETAQARVAELEPLVAKVADLEQTIVKLKQSPEDQEAEYLASLPDVIRKRYEQDQLEKIELRKKLEDAENLAEQTTYIAKTAAFKPLGMVQKHWPILKAIDAMPEEPREELTRLLKALTAQMQTSALFDAKGATGFDPEGSAGMEPDAEGRFLAKAKAHATENKIALDAAISAVAQSDPDLWRQYQVEKRRTNKV